MSDARRPHVHDDDESLHHHPEDVKSPIPTVTGPKVADTHVYDDDESVDERDEDNHRASNDTDGQQ